MLVARGCFDSTDAHASADTQLFPRSTTMMSARNEDNSEVDEMFAEAEKKFNDMYGGRVPKIPRKKKDAAEIQDLLAEAESDKHQLNSLMYVVFIAFCPKSERLDQHTKKN